MNKEIRNIEGVEFRAIEEDGKKYIEGYALKFNSESKDLGGFKEIIETKSINENTDLSDVVALFNHSNNYVLARKNTDVDTLELTVDTEGLKYKFEVDEEVSYIKDLHRNIQKKNISKSSFAFYLPQDGSGERWEKVGNQYYRYITQFKKISDVSPVTNPAYDSTSSMVRSFEDVKKELDKDVAVEVKEEIKGKSEDCDYKYHSLKK
ncbi:HK97 family phage prohead protease [Algoriphagus sp. D3-2-R+10]|uniref:HK97 family phage prohead protease n=1 Tax=Algoriphagus aurantiacus TaxID=3103948 RepID=UPI002B3692C7|nr:HK97 family phage prohead protease [Algoriphagus sp. D3-2-R+10]MEB2775226.1 HK97 family phage prohead protease [Algoriphagus sp. D3-2-R+10]